MTNSAGQSVVYGFGGLDVVEGGFGEGTGSNLEIYNAGTDTWKSDTSRVYVFSSNGVGTIGGKLYFSGGYVGIDGGDPQESRQVWAYDPAARRLVQRADMPRFTAEGVTGVIGGKLYVVGGFNSSQPVADLDVYDPATDTWKTLAPIPTAGRARGTALQAKLYVVSGSNAYVYNPGTNKWRTIAAPTWVHDGVVRVVIDGKPRLLAVGGNHGPHFDIPNDSELYTP